MIAHPDLSRALANSLSFRVEDLAQNRVGKLAARQAGTLALTYLAFAGMTVLFPIGFLVWLIATNAAPNADVWIVFYCVAIPLLALGAFTLWDVRRLLADLASRRVSQAVGQAHAEALTRVLRGKPDTHHLLHIGERAFPIPPSAAEALRPERVYRAYFLPRSGKLVSLEVIG